MSPDPAALVILTNTDDLDHASRMATELVERKLAACVNIVPRIRSVYFWKEEVVQEEEHLLLIKTREDLLEPLRAAIRELHTYELPEVIAIPVAGGDAAYLNWIRDSTRQA